MRRAAFTAALDTTAEITAYSGDTVANAARSFLAGVTTAAPSTDAVNTAVASVTNTSGSGSNEAGKSYVLTTAQDVLTGTNSGDFFRAVAGVQVGSQDQTTLNSSDIIDGGAGADSLIVNMTGAAYNGGARIKNVETLKIGTNQPAATFDYNVNAGSNEVENVETVVADQINVGETLSVVNVVRTDKNGAKLMPTLSWENDSNTVNAGTVNYTYRAAELTGSTDEQKIQLKSVTSGVLNLSAGVETASVTSMGTERVTLNNSSNLDSGNNAVAADIVSAGSLTKVNLAGTAEIGKAAGIVAATGLTDRVAGADTGITTASTASNLLSVESRVTEVNASAATAATNVRFVAKNDNSDTDVKYTGGSANDYVEFERGAVNADGGKGNDTFAFITTAAGITNSGFGSTDTVKGGEGTDVIQLGLNGSAGSTYTLSTTEFNNKTGIDELDLRGANNDVTVSSEFVAAADAGKFVIRTDKIVQSAAGTANATGTGANEDASTSVINLTALNQNQGIKVVGGSGSERVVVNNASLNAATEIDGGTNGAVAGRYDTVTVLNSAVLDSGDLANVKNIESLVLAETVTGNSTFRIDLTEAFVLANTAAVNDTATTIDDSVFRIGSAASSTGTALNAGDTVTIDISGLLNGTRTALTSNLTGRGIDVNFAAGVTVNYVVDGAAATTAQVALVTKADANRADAGVNSAAGAVIATPAFTGTAAADTYTLVANADGVSMLAGNDTLTIAAATAAPTGSLNGGDGTDTITLTAVANLSGATISGFERIDNGGNAVTLSAAQVNGFTGGLIGAGAITINDSGAAADASASTSTTYELANGGSFTGNAAVNYTITESSGTATNETVTIAAGWTTGDSVNLGAGTADKFVLAYDVAGAIDLASVAATLVNVEQFQSTVNQSNGTITLDAGLNTVDLSAQTTATTITATGVTFNSLTLGAANDTINVLTTGATAATINMGAGTDTITSLVTGAGAVSLTFGAGNDTITNFTTHGAGVVSFKFGAPGAATQSLTFAATTAKLSANDVFDFATNVTSIITGAANGTNGVAGAAGQLFVDTTTLTGGTIVTFDADGSRTFSAGDVQITITGNVLGFGIDASGNAYVSASA